eukprot:849677-Rhodomonas_salina.2
MRGRGLRCEQSPCCDLPVRLLAVQLEVWMRRPSKPTTGRNQTQETTFYVGIPTICPRNAVSNIRFRPVG